MTRQRCRNCKQYEGFSGFDKNGMCDDCRPVAKSRVRLNDDATYNRSNLTAEDAMAAGLWHLVPSERGDSMG